MVTSTPQRFFLPNRHLLMSSSTSILDARGKIGVKDTNLAHLGPTTSDSESVDSLDPGADGDSAAWCTVFGGFVDFMVSPY